MDRMKAWVAKCVSHALAVIALCSQQLILEIRKHQRIVSDHRTFTRPSVSAWLSHVQVIPALDDIKGCTDVGSF